MEAYLEGALVVLLLSSFVKLATTLSILRIGLGLNGSGFGAVVLGVSLGLSLLIMGPYLYPENGESILKGGSIKSLEPRFRPFLEKHAHPDITKRFQTLSSRLTETKSNETANATVPFYVLIPSFLVSELKEAFQVGVVILIPFLVIDVVVVNLLMALGMVSLPLSTITIPLKLLAFFAVDGWTLISEKIVSTYL